MSTLQERIELMRRTGGALPPEGKAQPAAAATSSPAGSSRARRFAGSPEDFGTPDARLPAASMSAPAAPQQPTVTAVRGVQPMPRAGGAAARHERFAAGAPALAGSPASNLPPGATAPDISRLAAAPEPGSETAPQQDMHAHCMIMWACTPQRPCDRELVLHSAAWYERTAPWLYAGLHAMVSRTLDRLSEDPSESRKPIEQGSGAAQATARTLKPAANETRVDHPLEQVDGRASRAARWGQRGG